MSIFWRNIENMGFSRISFILKKNQGFFIEHTDTGNIPKNFHFDNFALI